MDEAGKPHAVVPRAPFALGGSNEPQYLALTVSRRAADTIDALAVSALSANTFDELKEAGGTR